MAANDRPDEGTPRQDPPDFKVYKSRRGFFKKASGELGDTAKSSRLEAQESGRAQRPDPGEGDGLGGRPPIDAPRTARGGWSARRVIKWLVVFAGIWILISLVAFMVSAQIQKGKLSDTVKSELEGGPLLALSPQTILILGTDIRSGQFAGPAEAAPKACLRAAGSGRKPPSKCMPYRSDTIMLLRAGGGSFRKLSIPRDTLAEVPGFGAEKINAAYALGGAKLTTQTVSDFLGTHIDQIAILDFDGFRSFIDSIGGVEVDLPTRVCSSVSGGAFNLNLKKGKHRLDGYQAITLARTRGNTCGSGRYAGTDYERTQFQQLILDGVKNTITDPTRIPYNFIKGPIIGWNAPKMMVSSMGALTMPQLIFAAAIGGSSGTDFVEPTSVTPAGNLVVPVAECERAVRELLGKAPERAPLCSPGA